MNVKQIIKDHYDNSEACLYFADNQLEKHFKKNPLNETEVQHILDYVYSTKKKFKTIGYSTMLEKANAWSKKLQAVAVKDVEVDGVDYEVVKRWKNGYKVVKLLSEDAYKREGKLMSHCVADYFGRDDVIYSLRDKKNLPHCTMSNNSGQVKGKGNNALIPKYVKYVVEYLEESGMKVGDSEMKNLGYINIEDIEDENAVFNNLFRKKYFYRGNKVLDKNGNEYQSVGLWSKFGLISNSKFQFNFNLSVKTFSNNVYNNFGAQNSNNFGARDSNTFGARDYNNFGAQNYNTFGTQNSNTFGARDSNSFIVKSENYGAVRSDNIGILDGENNVVACGRGSIMSGKKGSLMIFVRVDKDNNVLGAVNALIDGKEIKENVWYKLEKPDSKKLVEVELDDDQKRRLAKAKQANKLGESVVKDFFSSSE